MSFRFALPAVLAALIFVPSCVSPPAPGLQLDYEAYELSNGLDVVLHVDRSDPVAAVAMTFHAGSSREEPGRTGFAHLFEHLFFLDSEHLGPGGLDRLMTRVGSSTNGSTNRDRTNYFEVVPIDGLEKTLWAEADKLGWFINTVTESVLAKEKQVVKNEKRQGVDNRPYGHTNYVIDRALYPEGHPYRWQVIGSLQDLDAAELDDVRAFHARWYGPNNATLVVAGDIDVEQTRAWIERYFGEIPVADMPARLPVPVVELAASRRIMHEDRFARLPELTIAWPTVPRYHEDEPALDVLAALLTDGKTAPFYEVVVKEDAVAPAASAYQSGSELAGRFTLRIRAFEGMDLDSVQASVERSFARFEETGVPDEQLRRIKASVETGFYSGLSSVLGKAFQMAEYAIFAGSPGFAQEELDRLLAVTAADVMRVYDTYLRGRPHVATAFVPTGSPELALSGAERADVYEEPIVPGAEAPVQVTDRGDIPRTPSVIDRSEEPPFGPSPALSPPPVWQDELANGLRILGIDDRELPLVQFLLVIRGGQLLETPGRTGVANLLAETMLEGTAKRTAEELEMAVDLLGASIRVSAGQDAFTIQGSTLARNFDETMALAGEILLEPRFDVEAFERAQQRVLARLRANEGEPNAIASDIFARLVYGDHILAENRLGTAESVASFTVEDLRAWHGSALVPGRAALHVAGAVDRERVVEVTRSMVAEWEPADVELPAAPTWDPARAGLYFVDVPGASQSVLRIGYLAMAESDPDYVPATFMNFRLGGGGFASDLTQVLREQRGYTYGIGSGFAGGRGPGPFQIASSVRTNITLEALDLVKQIVERHGPDFDADDLEATRNFVLRSNARRFETLGAKLGMLVSMSEYGFPADYVVRQEEVIRSMTVERVRELADRFLDPGGMIWLVVGDAATQRDRLDALGLGRVIDVHP